MLRTCISKNIVFTFFNCFWSIALFIDCLLYFCDISDQIDLLIRQDLTNRMKKLWWNSRVRVICEHWTPATKVAKIQRAFFFNWMFHFQLKKHLKQGLPKHKQEFSSIGCSFQLNKNKRQKQRLPKLKQQFSPVGYISFNWISARNKGCQNSHSTFLLLDASVSIE
jgi:hypothetical protein